MKQLKVSQKKEVKNLSEKVAQKQEATYLQADRKNKREHYREEVI